MLLSVNKVPKKLGTDTLNKVLDFAEKYLKLNPKLEIHIDFIRVEKGSKLTLEIPVKFINSESLIPEAYNNSMTNLSRFPEKEFSYSM